ncbi:MAG: DUF99 family protein [Candidatus Aenigmatarchaeota archaeon]
MLREIKKEIRILGWDDSPFDEDDEKVSVVGVVCRGGNYIDGILKTEVTRDGLDATQKLVEKINQTKHKDQLRVVMLDGITYAGFNTVDIEKLYEKTGLPVIVVVRKKTGFKAFKKALKNLPNEEKRLKAIKNAGNMEGLKIKGKEIYFQRKGISRENTKKVIKISATHSLLPEPIRVAHLIASGIEKGESVGSA